MGLLACATSLPATATLARMHTSYDRNSYDPSSFDDEMCLRPPALLWIAALYLSRAILLPVTMGLGHFAGVNDDAMHVLRAFWRADTLLPALLAVPILYALCRRQPSASRLVRRFWQHGRILLALSAALDAGLGVRGLFSSGITDDGILRAFGVATDVYFLCYVLAARRVHDTFCDFPAPLEG